MSPPRLPIQFFGAGRKVTNLPADLSAGVNTKAEVLRPARRKRRAGGHAGRDTKVSEDFIPFRFSYFVPLGLCGKHGFSSGLLELIKDI